MLNKETGRPIKIKDEGVTVTSSAESLDLVGANITATGSGANVTATLAGAVLSNPVAVAEGGTGVATLTGILIGAGTSALTATALGASQSIRRNSANTAYEAFTPSSESFLGTVTSVSVTTAQGVSGSVATATTTPAITLTLGALTGVTSFNGLVVTANTGDITTGTWNGTAIAVAKGGTNATSASITAFNNITGYTASGATGTTSTNLVFSTSPALTTPTVVTSIVGDATFAAFNTVSTTINFAGAATTLNIGASATCILNFGGSTTASEFRFLEPSASGVNYSAFKAVAQAANITYSLPPTVGAASTVLTDAAGNGVLTWAVPTAGSAGAMTLLKAGSGTTTTSTAENVDSIAITGLTALDTLLVYVTMEAAGANTVGGPLMYNNTDAVNINTFTGGDLTAVRTYGGHIIIRQAQSANTKVFSAPFIAHSAASGSNTYPAISTFTTAWTGSWTLAFRHTGVVAGCTFNWSWAVYKVAGQ